MNFWCWSHLFKHSLNMHAKLLSGARGLMLTKPFLLCAMSILSRMTEDSPNFGKIPLVFRRRVIFSIYRQRKRNMSRDM